MGYGGAQMEAISNFFKPSSVAIIGASAKKGKVGNIILVVIVVVVVAMAMEKRIVKINIAFRR